MKNWLIAVTGREYLIYKIVDQLVFLFLKIKTRIFNGHIIRKKRISAYLQSHTIRKLHLGCGGNYLDGFLNSDVFGNMPIDVTKRLPFPSHTFDLIYSDQLVEHIYKKQFINYLKESYRILKKGGIQIICTPSIEKIARIMYGDDIKNKNIMTEYHKKFSLDDGVFGSSYINDFMHINFGHKYLYDVDYIRYLALKTKYIKIEKVDNFDVPDMIIKNHLQKNKDIARDLTSETFILYK